MNKDAFSGFHPAVNLAFFVAALGMTMFIQQPVYLLISMVSGCAYLLYLQGKKGMLRQVGYLIPLLLMMAVMNPMWAGVWGVDLLSQPDRSTPGPGAGAGVSLLWRHVPSAADYRLDGGS